MRLSNRHKLAVTLLDYSILSVMVLLPFTAFITTWLGSNFGHLDLFRIWKEIVVCILAIPVALLAVRDSETFRWLRYAWLPRLIGLYALLHLVIGFIGFTTEKVSVLALIYALLINLRFFGFFMIVLIVAGQSDFLARNWKKIIFAPAATVIVFGLLQKFILPYDFLRHFGYDGIKTILEYQTIDNKVEYYRVQSTLRGPNPLGAYLLLVLVLFILVLKDRTIRLLSIVSGLGVLFYSYSRSAIIGLMASSGVLLLTLKNKKKRRVYIIMATALTLTALTVVYSFRNNNSIQNVFFHTDETSKSAGSPNAYRWSYITQASRDIMNEPFGRSPGTAGPASMRNEYTRRLSENYFLQIGQEVGLIGVGLFVGINAIVGAMLWQFRKDKLALGLLAILVGMVAVNMVSHAWADEVIAFLFWGLAGIACAPILKSKSK